MKTQVNAHPNMVVLFGLLTGCSVGGHSNLVVVELAGISSAACSIALVAALSLLETWIGRTVDFGFGLKRFIVAEMGGVRSRNGFLDYPL